MIFSSEQFNEDHSFGRALLARQYRRQRVFSFFLHIRASQELTSLTKQKFPVLFSQDTSLFCLRLRNCQGIQFWLYQDSSSPDKLI